MTCHCATKEIHAQRALDQADWSSQQTMQRLQKDAETEAQRIRSRLQELQERSPDPDRFAIDDIEQVGPHLVVKVEYQGCIRCSYDRRKVMVFLDTDMKQAIKWRRIDPHFREPGKPTQPASQAEAPSPAARFPASHDGWTDAINYAMGKKPTVYR